MTLQSTDGDNERWAVRCILIRLKVDIEFRDAEERTPRSWPDLSDLYEAATERLDRLYAGRTSPLEMLQECNIA